MRLFLAIDIPKRAKDDIISIQKKLKPHVNAKYVERENLHITLKFFGEVEKVDLLNPLKEIKFKPFHILLSELGAFPSVKYAKVIWVGIDKGFDEITKLHSEIESKIHFEKDRNFHPHITIARVKSKIEDKQILSKSLNNEFEARQFVLYRSTLTPSGPVYQKLASYPE
jgi:2'-5' RNA ligase